MLSAARRRSDHQLCNGHSSIVGPIGRIVADTGNKEGLALATVDPIGELARSKSPEFVAADLPQSRRPETYNVLRKPFVNRIDARPIQC